MAAGLAMLTELNNDRAIFTRLAEKTEYLHRGCSTVLNARNIKHTINRMGSMFSIHFAEDMVLDFESSTKGNNETFKTFFHGMLNEGIYIAPSAFETWFICDALTYQDLDETIAAVGRVAEHL
jgi:glutamate-1-semialdehyde 2,1-aminomutase